jgi:hypothetical protein
MATCQKKRKDRCRSHSGSIPTVVSLSLSLSVKPWKSDVWLNYVQKFSPYVTNIRAHVRYKEQAVNAVRGSNRSEHRIKHAKRTVVEKAQAAVRTARSSLAECRWQNVYVSDRNGSLSMCFIPASLILPHLRQTRCFSGNVQDVEYGEEELSEHKKDSLCGKYLLSIY